jgi:hypothetical protein
MQRKAALDLQVEHLQHHKAASAAAAAAAELAATAAAHQTYPYGIPEHLLQQEQQQQQAEQQQLMQGEEGCTVQQEVTGQGPADINGVGESLMQCHSIPTMEQQQQQDQQDQHTANGGQQPEAAAEPGAQSAPHVTWREEPHRQQASAAAAAAGSCTSSCVAADGGPRGWHGLVVDCSVDDEAVGSEQLQDEDAQATLLLQRPNTGDAQGKVLQLGSLDELT